jgi:3-hydroxyisobutyrate dehydrogenase-like beta-hydroxyacid dehydrogenase
MQFGFVGLGQMGKPMALNLARQLDVIAFDARPVLMPEDAPKTLEVTGNLSELANCDCVFLSLPSAGVVKSVLLSEDGLARHLKKGAIIVDTSTIEYNATLEISASLSEKGYRFVDAPVSGMQARAEDGTLTMMCGGSSDDIAPIEFALKTMASKVLYMGPVGSGQLTKLINQLLFDINMAALAEILPISAKLGLDSSKIAEIVNSGTGRSYASEFFIPNILKGNFSNGYPMQNAYKDLISGSELSARQLVPTPVLAAATATYQRALLEGHGDKDKGAMVLVFEELLKTRFRDQDGGVDV